MAKYGILNNAMTEDEDRFYSLLADIEVAILKAKFKGYKDIKKAERLKQVLTECLTDCNRKIEILKKEEQTRSHSSQ